MKIDNLELSIYKTGEKIFNLIKEDCLIWWEQRRWEGELFKLGINSEKIITQILRFIEVYPVLSGPDDVMDHLKEYHGVPGIPK